MQPIQTPNVSVLLNEVKSLINQSRRNVAVSVNAELTLLHWQVGQAINQNLLANKRAEYGKQVVTALAQQLLAEYGGTGFAEKTLQRMMQFAEVFPEKSIVVSVIRQLSWTHLIALFPIKDDLKRAFYTEMCRIERWSVRVGKRLFQPNNCRVTDATIEHNQFCIRCMQNYKSL